MICLCQLLGGFLLGHGWWQLTPVAWQQLFTSSPSVCSNLFWACVQKCIYFVGWWAHSCTFPCLERVQMLQRICGHLEGFWQRGHFRCLWLHTGSERKILHDKHWGSAATVCWAHSKHRITGRHVYTHQTWIQSKPLVMTVHGDWGDNLLPWLPRDCKPTRVQLSHGWPRPWGIEVWGSYKVETERLFVETWAVGNVGYLWDLSTV